MGRCKSVGAVFMLLFTFLLILPGSSPSIHSFSELLSAQSRKDVAMEPADFNHTYSGMISREGGKVYVFNYTRLENETDAIRISVSSLKAERSNPILVVLKQQFGVVSWQIPLFLDKIYPFHSTSRTLCPTINYLAEDKDNSAIFNPNTTVYQTIYVDLSTASMSNVDFTFRAQQVADFFVTTDIPTTINVSPSEPQYVEYVMPEGIDHVLVSIESLEPEKFCSYFSIQPVRCPVADIESELRVEGIFQTITWKGSIVVGRGEMERFYIVLTVRPVDYLCQEIEKIIPHANASSSAYSRVKAVKIKVTESISFKGYMIAVAACVGFFIGFYLITCLLISSNIVKWKYCCGKITKERASKEDVTSHGKVLDELQKDIEGNPIPDQSAQLDAASSSNNNPAGTPNVGSSNNIPRGRHGSGSSVESDPEVDDDEFHEVVRTKSIVYVTDLTHKSRERLSKKDRQYRWSMITICIFYGLPVAQLVITYQRVLRNTGNEDLCYYNFACANPLGIVSDFNHVISNSGYILLGFLFILLVRRRQLQYIKAKMENADDYEGDKAKGVSPQFELFYAMGLALIMEGLMSSSYHICPSYRFEIHSRLALLVCIIASITYPLYSNFQFDTSFMYLIGGLGMLKMYQTRHPDILPNAYISYAFFAFIILMSVIGVVYISLAVWIIFSVMLFLLAWAVSAQIYYLGHWSLNFGIPYRFYVRVRNQGFFIWPAHMNRFVPLSIVMICNLALAVIGPVLQPLDFASYILACFVSNFALYVLFYLIMKLRNGERISRLTIIFMLLAVGAWSGSLYLFHAGPIDWQVTPSRSREVNRPCFLLHFYDEHDVWHMTSACSLFFSFMVMLTVDDDLLTVLRSQIVVF